MLVERSAKKRTSSHLKPASIHTLRTIRVRSVARFVMSNERKKQFLQKKVSFTLLAVMAVLAVVSYAILNAVIAPAFDELENG